MSLNQQLLLSISALHGQLLKQLERRLSMHGLSFTELQVLKNLNEAKGTLRRIDLAQQTGLSASGITRLLLPMEKLGLVSRQQNPRDARVSEVVLTAAGARVLSEASQTFADCAEDIFAALNEQQQQALQSALQTLQDAIATAGR
ncbi:MarR family winged helix-turn-helix transcriptional regulator [Gallaecimonas mangrovi]|uniref:MarR family winged helix-turn-helix transcriptional regulator n=1 Tax=Gallaecimonas mangrovi TaxID=2291597 RepID=UPI000E1FCCC7|nr:MarR family transcriptional regulator [Gallaecimonas mangrovi]